MDWRSSPQPWSPASYKTSWRFLGYMIIEDISISKYWFMCCLSRATNPPPALNKTKSTSIQGIPSLSLRRLPVRWRVLFIYSITMTTLSILYIVINSNAYIAHTNIYIYATQKILQWPIPYHQIYFQILHFGTSRCNMDYKMQRGTHTHT